MLNYLKRTLTIKQVLIAVIVASSLGIKAQEPEKKPTPQVPVNASEINLKASEDNYGWSKRISFIFGAGPSVVKGKLYQDVSIDKSSNFVQIEEADRVRTPISLGILYTPFVSDIRRRIKTSDKDSVILYDHYPRGFSIGLFINPFELSSINATQTSQVDLGIGLGYRTGSFSILVTSEFFALRQPKQSFIDYYMNKNLTYNVNNEIQTSINVNEESVYRSKKFISFGLKLAYTFDIAKSYFTSTR